MPERQVENFAPSLADITKLQPIINTSNPAGGLGLTLEERGIISPRIVHPVEQDTILPSVDPKDGQQIEVVDDSTDPLYRWMFRYNNLSTSDYKWEFIGGTPAYIEVDTDEALGTAGAWSNLTTNGPLFTLPLNGDFLVQWSVRMYTGAGGDTVWAGVAVGDTSPASTYAQTKTAAGENAHSSGIDRFTGLSATNVLKIRYFSTARTDNHFTTRHLIVTPIRCSKA